MSDQSSSAPPALPAALEGIRVCDLTRILAGPTCTQLLGDLGADVIKIEKPLAGDDTRKWGPPYVKNAQDQETTESAYYLSANRNKRSVAIDIATNDGQKLIRQILKHCDILVENYKVGGLAKYGLSYEDLKDEYPRLIYCSITGFGQTGPYARRAGYDYLAQAMSGLMSITGHPETGPVKVGIGVADLLTGIYANVAILAALRHRDQTGEGQHLDLALLDCQVSWLVNEGTNYLLSGKVPPLLGDQHANIVPYKVVPASDGQFILAIGNDHQFQKFCTLAGNSELADDPRFKTNSARVKNRTACNAAIEALTATRTRDEWLAALDQLGVPAGPLHTLDQVFADPQVQHRDGKITMPYPLAKSGKVSLLGNPIHASKTPPTYRWAPPTLGQHTDEVLANILQMPSASITQLRKKGVIG